MVVSLCACHLRFGLLLLEELITEIEHARTAPLSNNVMISQ
jgi:hypothetical protein